MVRFRLEIDSDGSALNDDPQQETADLLARARAAVLDGQVEGPLLDSNGNTVGRWALEVEGA